LAERLQPGSCKRREAGPAKVGPSGEAAPAPAPAQGPAAATPAKKVAAQRTPRKRKA